MCIRDSNLFSVNHNYGSPDELKYLIDCCHREGLAVILDIVFNHFGPEGNYLAKFGPYFTDKYETPWGAAVNFDDTGCAAARRMVLDSVRHWIERYHFDGLRLDAVHAIKDHSRPHILEEIATAARELEERFGRRIVIIAETDANDVQLIKSTAVSYTHLDVYKRQPIYPTTVATEIIRFPNIAAC